MKMLRPPSPAGAIGAVVSSWFTLVPSLLPRGAVLQGIVTGLAAALGYGLGVGLARGFSAIRRGQGARGGAVAEPADSVKRAEPVESPADEPDAAGAEVAAGSRRPWGRVAALGLAAISVLMLGLWVRWQRESRALVGMDTLPVTSVLVVVAVALVVGALLVLLGRGIAALWRRFVAWLHRVLPSRAVLALGVVALVVLGVLLVTGALGAAVNSASEAVFARMDEGTDPGVTPPESPLRSGGPGSVVRWEDLGQSGRTFVATGPSQSDIEWFRGGPARPPIRVFAGMRSADDVAGQIELIVEELDRTGAWDREVLVLYTTASSGLVDPDVVDSVEMLWSGDTATAAFEYSYLPSWMSFLLDRQSAADAGRALVDGVRGHWEKLPVELRPKLVVFGESLGSYGTEMAFDDLAQMREQVDGAFLVGPPFMSPIWADLVDHRDPGSPVWLPRIGDGDEVRFANGVAELRAPFGDWQEPRVLYLDNGSDPVTWWSPELLWSKPEWLEGERAPDVGDDIFWLPVVTLLQTTVDLANAQSVPDGHGHNYGATVADGWAAVLPPPGWTQADTDRLHDWLRRRHG